MSCKYCDRVINNKGSLVKHEKGCKLNPNRVVCNNLTEYKQRIKLGIEKGQNQYTKAKQEGRIIVMSLEERQRRSERGKKYKPSNETREKLSAFRSKYNEEMGLAGFKCIKWYKIKNNLGEEYIVRGTWELKVAEWLNKNNILWKRRIYLKYIKEEIKRTYTPDFYLPETNQYIEVKGYFSQLDREKLELVQEQNKINLLIWFDKQIKDLDKMIDMIK